MANVAQTATAVLTLTMAIEVGEQNPNAKFAASSKYMEAQIGLRQRRNQTAIGNRDCRRWMANQISTTATAIEAIEIAESPTI